MKIYINNIRYNKKKVSVVTVGEKYNEAICSFSDEQIKYEDVIQESVTHSYIDVLQERIEKNLANTFTRNQVAYDGTTQFKHIGLEFFCEMQMKTCCLMIYEVYNCIKNLSDGGKVLFYNYSYKGKAYVGICPSGEKEYLKSTHGLLDTDFTVIDLAAKVEDYYSKYKKS